MKKLLAAAMVAGLFVGGATVAQAGHDDDRPAHEPGDNGLCNAFFKGEKNGWETNGYPPPFQSLVDRADDGNDDTSVEDDVRSYCGALAPAEGSPGTRR